MQKLIESLKAIAGKMRRITSTACGIASLSMALTLPAVGQVSPETIANLSGGTNRIIAATSNVYTAAINSTIGSQLAVQLSFKMVSAGATSNVWFYLDDSVDGVTWNVRKHVLGKAANGTTEVVMNTNINIGGMPYHRLSELYNTNTVAATNITFKAAVKRGI